MFLWVPKIGRDFDKPLKLKEFGEQSFPMSGYNRNFGAITNLGQWLGFGYPSGTVQ